jgi:hypothetical protein
MNGAALPVGSILFHAPRSKEVSSVHGSSNCCWGSVSAGGGAVHYDERSCGLNSSDYDAVLDDAKKFVLDWGERRQRRERKYDNLKLSFMGDSMTRQTFAGLECEIRKIYGCGRAARRTHVLADAILAHHDPRFRLPRVQSVRTSTPLAPISTPTLSPLSLDVCREAEDFLQSSIIYISLSKKPKRKIGNDKPCSFSVSSESKKPIRANADWGEIQAHHCHGQIVFAVVSGRKV